MSKRKWSRPFSGACLEYKIDGMIYYIADTLEGVYCVEAMPSNNFKHTKFATFKEVYAYITGLDPQKIYDQMSYAVPGHEVTESEARNMVLSVTHDPGAGESLRAYVKDGQDYAVDLWKKEVWPYWMPERISGFFNSEKECREWADAHIDEKHGQVSLFNE